MVSNLVTIVNNYFLFLKLVSISCFSCSDNLYIISFFNSIKHLLRTKSLRNTNIQSEQYFGYGKVIR